MSIVKCGTEPTERTWLSRDLVQKKQQKKKKGVRKEQNKRKRKRKNEDSV